MNVTVTEYLENIIYEKKKNPIPSPARLDCRLRGAARRGLHEATVQGAAASAPRQTLRIIVNTLKLLHLTYAVIYF